MRLYDSLSRRVRPLEPLDPPRVRMYACGPTVYDRAHIGNFRAFAVEDLLRRYLKFKGYEVEQAMNITDVDDRTITAASERGVSLEEVTEPVIEMFLEDWRALGLEEPEHRPRATEHVEGMIRLVERLSERGLTYESGGSVYFAIGRFPGYGGLAGIAPEQVAGAGRAQGDEEYDKDDPRDFVLWKGSRDPSEAVASWDSPWGPGRPGWHLECSAMAMSHFGETLDIHAGGVDNLFPHHTNEIAQSEGATGKAFARHWVHAEHLQVEGRKMSKSLGNCYTLPQLAAMGHAPSAIRYLLLSGHYRAQLNFTFDGVEAAARAVNRLWELRRRLRVALEADAVAPGAVAATEADAAAPGAAEANADAGAPDLAEAAARGRAAFEAALDDDLNASEALAAVFGLAREANHALAADRPPDRAGIRAALAALDDFERVFGVLVLRDREAEAEAKTGGRLAEWAEELAREREEARARRDWTRADAIRSELEAAGVVVEDQRDGSRLRVGAVEVLVPRLPATVA